jgi:hypothetical protein
MLRAVIVAGAGSLAGAAWLVVACNLHPALTLEMDRPLPRSLAAGVYPPERSGTETFAWTGGRADFTMRGADRRTEWTCSLRFRGGRAAPLPQPQVDAAIDGITVATAIAANDYRQLDVTAPARPGHTGLTLTLTSSTTVSPGAADPRQLGVQLDRLVCQPTGALVVLPPRSTLRNAAFAAGVIGLAVALAGLSLPAAIAAAMLLAAGQAWLLSTGLAPYSGFSRTMVPVALWIAAAILAVVRLPSIWLQQPMSPAARSAVIVTASALYLKLGGLLHPSKQLADAVFHAHRFEWVLAGRFYFTQPTGGVTFPYAIGLYLFAAPWTFLTRDYVTLLRIVVCTSDVVAGALLYVAISRVWKDRLSAVLAVVLFNVVPAPYGVLGDANMTNAFGQSAALIALIVATAWSQTWRRPTLVVALFGLTALAFLSHVSTVSLLVVTLLSAAFFWWNRGDDSDRGSARVVVIVTVAAALFSVITYYGHFMDVYKTAWRARTAAAIAAPATPSPRAEETATAAPVPVRVRVMNALKLTRSSVGWPILILAAAGGWRTIVERRRDRLVGLVAAWIATYLVFTGVALMRVDAPLQRYAAEFVGRVVLGTYPGAVTLAAAGAAWGWRSGRWGRLAAGGTVVWAIAIAVQLWSGWFA